MIPFTSLINYDSQGSYSRTKQYICYAISLLPLLVYALHIYYPLSVTFETVILTALFGVGLSSWAGGYKAGIIYTLLFVIVLNIPLVFLNLNSPIKEPRLLVSSFLLVISGILLSFLVDAARRQEKILLYKKREKEMKKRIYDLEIETANYKKEIRSRDEFLTIASHELKTPLTSMLIQTQTALHNIRNVSLAQFSIESLLKMLVSVEHQTKRLSKMINELFNISIMTTGNLVLEKEPANLTEITQQVLNDFYERIQHEGYTVTFEHEDNITGNWDKVRITQAITNLLSNAIKYGNKRPINIRAKKTNNFAELIISDHGIGIAKKKQREIFGLFERADQSGNIKGLGVGLYISRQIVEAHKGTILVSSRLGKGTTFIVRLPQGLQAPSKK